MCEAVNLWPLTAAIALVCATIIYLSRPREP